MKTPNLGEAHCGDGALQSAQRSLLFAFWISRSLEESALLVMCFCTGNLCRSDMDHRNNYLRPRLRIHLPHRLGGHLVPYRECIPG